MTAKPRDQPRRRAVARRLAALAACASTAPVGAQSFATAASLRAALPWIAWGVLAVAAGLLVGTMITNRRRRAGTGAASRRSGLLALVPAAAIVLFGVVGTLAMVVRPFVRVAVVATATANGWSYRYARYGITSDDELWLPAGRTSRITIVSDGVIRSFWVPEAGIRSTIMPGNPVTTAVRPTQVGSFPVLSSLECGIMHYAPMDEIEVVPVDAFANWAQSRAAVR